MGVGGSAAPGCPVQTTMMVRLATASAIVGVIAACIFVAVPQIDLAVSALFYIGKGDFAGNAGIVPILREGLIWSYVTVCVLSVVGLTVTIARDRSWLGLGSMQWIFLALCLGIGPGIVANEIFKDNWGRARPRQITEFAGSKPFTPALLQAQNCSRNCSFVSGEASSLFAMAFAAAALFHRRVRVLIGAGVLLGGLAGLLRVAQGAHFLSDVVFAGVFMALTVTAIFLAFEARTAGGMDRVRFAVIGRTSPT